VKDQTGAVLPGVEVTMPQTETGIKRTVEQQAVVRVFFLAKVSLRVIRKRIALIIFTMYAGWPNALRREAATFGRL
jgi:hypothetical protein